MQCFLLLHLFGHSVQWVAPSLAHTVEALQKTDDRTRFMQVLRDYEGLSPIDEHLARLAIGAT